MVNMVKPHTAGEENNKYQSKADREKSADRGENTHENGAPGYLRCILQCIEESRPERNSAEEISIHQKFRPKTLAECCMVINFSSYGFRRMVSNCADDQQYNSDTAEQPQVPLRFLGEIVSEIIQINLAHIVLSSVRLFTRCKLRWCWCGRMICGGISVCFWCAGQEFTPFFSAAPETLNVFNDFPTLIRRNL